MTCVVFALRCSHVVTGASARTERFSPTVAVRDQSTGRFASIAFSIRVFISSRAVKFLFIWSEIARSISKRAGFAQYQHAVAELDRFVDIVSDEYRCFTGFPHQLEKVAA